MHEFPPASEMTYLIGDTLEQVSLDPFSTQFRFERNLLISEYAVEHTEPDGTVWKYKCVASEAPATLLHHLVGRTVVDVRSEGFRLTLLFDTGAALHVLSDDGPYEAGHIDGCDKFIVF
jgi:uncharacterized SAM-dependent methyltransferase